MGEKLIEFKTAKQAKEKGFDWICRNALLTNFLTTRDINTAEVIKELGDFEDRIDVGHNNYEIVNTVYKHKNNKSQPQLIARPTQSQLQTWLRDVYKINVESSVDYYSGAKFLGYYFTIISFFEDGTYNREKSSDTDKIYQTYELALEAGLITALNFINIL